MNNPISSTNKNSMPIRKVAQMVRARLRFLAVGLV